ncbi:MAG: VCBS repeat-containing protein [Cyclobacteriaceae bacterium]|nr:VCBS repeat-containing protein [Cyclobacteriaceae bacterium HetDA_MAG_MS6]
MRYYSLCLLSMLLWGACQQHDPLFNRVLSNHSGITFVNRITDSNNLNALNFEYLYNGAGLGVGDFNNDGKQDVFFAGSQVPGQLYLNRGDFRFEDVTSAAGITTSYWSTGVAVVDINGDGWMDIHLSTIVPNRRSGVPNQFFINQGVNHSGVPQFREMASEMNLADSSYSTQAVFLDFDRDGDLDMYLLCNALEYYDRTVPVTTAHDGSGRSNDQLYRNEGSSAKLPRFTNVTREAGILTEGWGLGVGISDFNQDGWPDIYCANDFLSNDILWMNNGDGTFTNKINELISHQSHNSMGMDIADINNDGLADIINLDMMPDDNLRQKTMFSRPGYDLYNTYIEKGYHPQFVRNTLQLNRGIGSNGQPLFSDVGYMAGVYATDWSWSALLADFDHDGYRDLWVTNGYRKDVTNLDFASYNTQPSFSYQPESPEKKKERNEQMAQLFGVKKSNFVFRNQDGMVFKDVTGDWGLQLPSYSNGAAYADFDNDGDLDIISNNIDDEALLYRNNTVERSDASNANHHIRIRLNGKPGNLQALSTTVSLYAGKDKWFVENSPYRGYKSSVDPVLHFGLGDVKTIDTIAVTWPDGTMTKRFDVSTDQLLTISWTDASAAEAMSKPAKSKYFSEGAVGGVNFLHEERDFIDFKRDHLLPHRHSQSGPGLAVGDMNNDGLEDFVIGGSAERAARVFYQKVDGEFEQQALVEKLEEDTGLLLFDADQDGDNDLYCVSGSSEYGKDYRRYQDRFYRNEGGVYRLDTAALPIIKSSGSSVIAADFDKDGDLDVFVGGRIKPNEYPMPPQSILLVNDGRGIFEDRTDALVPGLSDIGMVSSGIWSDVDNDAWLDLVLVGEFMPVVIFKNEKGRLRRISQEVFQNTVGWWNSIAGADFDNDGDIDYVAGNLGLNSIYQASIEEPVCVYAKDYDGNGSIDPILCRFIQGVEYPVHYRESMTDQILGLKKVFKSYEKYGRMSFKEIFSESMRKEAYVLQATEMRSLYIENLGNGDFEMMPLPEEAQFAPVYGILPHDVNQDGHLDLLTVGNSYAPDPLTGRYDASLGNCFLGNGEGHFESVPFHQSGWLVRGDAKALGSISVGENQAALLVTQNRDSLRSFLRGTIPYFNPERDDQYAVLTLKDGTKRKHEFKYGSSYLSQSSRSLDVSNVVTLEIWKNLKISRVVHFPR